MDYGLRGKVALVTGAASGIGRATAELLAGSGARVVASDADAEGGDAVVSALREAGAEAVFIAADVRDAEALRALVAQSTQEYGRLDCAVNCAGVGAGHAPTHEYAREEWDRVMDINLRGVWLAMRYEIEAMLATGHGGTVVNVSSTLGLRGAAFSSPYSASKHAVLGLTRTAAIEYASAGIRVNAVCPGAIDTPMMDETFSRFPDLRDGLVSFVPMNRMGRPGEVAHAIAWLSSEGSSFVTGEALAVEGGLLAR